MYIQMFDCGKWFQTVSHSKAGPVIQIHEVCRAILREETGPAIYAWRASHTVAEQEQHPLLQDLHILKNDIYIYTMSRCNM